MRHKVQRCSKKPWEHWHFKQFCPTNDGPETNSLPISPPGFTYFEADDRCAHCNRLILMEHNIFLFNNCPDAIRNFPGDPEWQPSPESETIPMDNGPARVAYVWGAGIGREGSIAHPEHIGEPVVMVHEGELDGIYTVCSAATVKPHGSAWLWICQPISPKNPASEDWMRSISS